MPETLSAAIAIDAPPERVFAYFTEPELMVRWMGEHAELDPSAGGRFACDIRGVPVRGRYLEIEPPHRLVLSWGHAGSDRLPPGSSTVEVRLLPDGEGTRVEISHRDLPASMQTGHVRGWRHFLARLQVVAAGGDPGPDTIEPPRV